MTMAIQGLKRGTWSWSEHGATRHGATRHGATLRGATQRGRLVRKVKL
jgi:hypothetical protein